MTPYWRDEKHGLAIYHGDCLEILPALGREFDLCLTDIPYLPEHSEDWSEWARAVHVVTVEGGAFVTEVAHITAAAIQDAFIPPWTFRWVFASLQPGSTARVYGKAIFVGWKRFLAFSKGNYTGPWCFDVFRSEGEGRGSHKWQQSPSIATAMLRRISSENDVVLDPFLGSGTTLVACYRLGREGVGIEISEEYCDLAVRRLETEIAQGRLFEPEEIAQAQQAPLPEFDDNP